MSEKAEMKQFLCVMDIIFSASVLRTNGTLFGTFGTFHNQPFCVQLYGVRYSS
jgi:hypothetical protein